ncbi:hypothetical protein M9Y10_038470 [Tritrichomonas musculus]|uniref:Surface antigen BspA-like n=1 Tax=Tritrichomonas musculus TaxID=1915356 RepID=A0ABR2K935_9EUKA
MCDKICQDNIIYSINEEEETAHVISSQNQNQSLLIPRLIKHNSKEYKVISISKSAFESIKTIRFVQFESKSEIQTIEQKAFYGTFITRISIPSSVTKICEKALCYCLKLQQVEFPPDSKLQIIGIRAFSETGIKSISIPSHVTQICKEAFCVCRQLQQIEIPRNSELKIIGDDAFNGTLINKIFIPASLTELEKNWCNSLPKITQIEVDPRNARYLCLDNKIIIGKSSPEAEEYDTVVFARRDIVSATIPSFIKSISSYAFEFCKQLERLEIPSDSRLHTIGDHAFSSSSITSISIPLHVRHIYDAAFYFCNKIQRFEIPLNSELEVIGKRAFLYSSIEFIRIPIHIKQIPDSAFCFCRKLKQVEIPPNSELQRIGGNSFNNTAIESILIPSHVTQICKEAFSGCNKLKRIDIPQNPELKIIEENAFESSIIDKIAIPASLTELKDGWCKCLANVTQIEVDPRNARYLCLDNKIIIGKSSPEAEEYDTVVFARRDIVSATIPSFIKSISSYAFEFCKQLERLEIPSDSRLHTIGYHAFSSSSITSIVIPPHVTKIFHTKYDNLYKLKIIEIDEMSENFSMNKRNLPSKAIIMIPVNKKQCIL